MKRTTTCKNCKRIIEGTTKFGLCDRCFDITFEKACMVIGISITSTVAIKKNWPEILKEVQKIASKIR